MLGIQQFYDCAVCQKKAHGKAWLCRVLYFCSVFLCQHLAKVCFAMCPKHDTWQMMGHTAYKQFLVVHLRNSCASNQNVNTMCEARNLCCTVAVIRVYILPSYRYIKDFCHFCDRIIAELANQGQLTPMIVHSSTLANTFLID